MLRNSQYVRAFLRPAWRRAIAEKGERIERGKDNIEKEMLFLYRLLKYF